MKSCQYAGDTLEQARSHPWTDSVGDASACYHDFKVHPGLIRTSLEDFLPWAGYPAVTRMYELLEELNGPRSSFETNDCALSPPHPSEAPSLGKDLQVSGRIMILYRELTRNLLRKRVEELTDSLHFALAPIDPDFQLGMIGTSIVPVHYRACAQLETDRPGWQLMILFWAWGDAESEVMGNLDRVLANLQGALASLA